MGVSAEGKRALLGVSVALREYPFSVMGSCQGLEAGWRRTRREMKSMTERPVC